MEQNKKNQIIRKIRTCSLVISVFCLVLAAFNGIALYQCINGTLGLSMTETDITRITVGYGFGLAIMLLSAVLFFTMSRSGLPFTKKKIILVLLIGALLLLNALVPTVILFPSIGIKAVLYLVTSSSLLESLMFLFAALIMYYASILQQESDETL